MLNIAANGLVDSYAVTLWLLRQAQYCISFARMLTLALTHRRAADDNSRHSVGDAAVCPHMPQHCCYVLDDLLDGEPLEICCWQRATFVYWHWDAGTVIPAAVLTPPRSCLATDAMACCSQLWSANQFKVSVDVSQCLFSITSSHKQLLYHGPVCSAQHKQ